MIRVAEAQFRDCLQVVARDVRFASLICDAGTVVNSKVVHSAFTNPLHIDDIVTLPPFENYHWDARCYQTFFRQTITVDTGEDVTISLEICGVICDNFAAKMSGLRNFLSQDAGKWTGIMHVPCLNHMINLVFYRAIREGVFPHVLDRFQNWFVLEIRKWPFKLPANIAQRSSAHVGFISLRSLLSS
jgi:hypothetical protein